MLDANKVKLSPTRFQKVAAKATLRAMSANLPDSVVDPLTGIQYFKDAADTTSADNGYGIIVTTGGTRYKADDAFMNVSRFGAKGDGVTDDSVAFQLAFNYAKAYGSTILMGPKTYVIGTQLDYITGTSIFTPGLRLEGAGEYRTKLLTKDLVGSVINIDGRGAGTYNHASGGRVSGFDIKSMAGHVGATHGITLNATYHTLIEQMNIDELGGDALRVIAMGSGDLATNEFLTLRNIYIRYCLGWGLKCFSASNQSVAWAEGIAEGVIIVGCQTGGIYAAGIQQVNFTYGACAANLGRNFVISGDGVTNGPLNIENYEIGNLSINAPMLEIERATNLVLTGCRFINNGNELSTNAILVGGGSNALVAGLEIIKPWIVQSRAANTTYEFLKFAPGYTPFMEGVRFDSPRIQELAAGKIVSTATKNKLRRYVAGGVDVVPLAKSVVSTANNLASYTPDGTANVVILNYTALTTTQITAPSYTPKDGEQQVFILRNNGGIGTAVFDTSNYRIDPDNLIRTPTQIYTNVTVLFVYNSLSNDWHIVAPATLREEITINMNDAGIPNPYNFTPDPRKDYRFNLNAVKTLNITAPSEGKKYQEFNMVFWNLDGVAHVVNIAGYNCPSTITIPTTQYQAVVANCKYITSNWYKS